MLKPIEANKKTMTAIVQDRIREAILAGELAPGSRIDQVRLAERLDVSLVPIREALNKLEGEGFIKIVPRRGAFVTNTSTSDMEDLYFARQILEGEIAYYAAPKLTEEDLQTLGGLMPKMGDALQKRDFDGFTEYNRQFHFAIYQAAGSKYMVNSITSLWDLAERYRYRYMFLQDQSNTIQTEHQAIYEACYARNSDKLRDAIVLHMQQTMHGIKQYLQSRHLDTSASAAPDSE